MNSLIFVIAKPLLALLAGTGFIMMPVQMAARQVQLEKFEQLAVEVEVERLEIENVELNLEVPRERVEVEVERLEVENPKVQREEVEAVELPVIPREAEAVAEPEEAEAEPK